jgi:broad specificity phosphatase PhoE
VTTINNTLYRIETHPYGGSTTLYLIRHGRTSGNQQRRLQGRTDIPLDELGFRQAALIAERLATQIRADALVASPLSRAVATATAISERMQLPIELHQDLVEMSFGDIEGLTLEEFATAHPELAALGADPENYDFGWPNGESRHQFHTRVKTTFESIMSTYRNHAVIVVAHGGVLGSLLAQMRGASPNDWRANQLANCSFSHVDVLIDRTVIHAMNDASHLSSLDDPERGDTSL